MNKINPIIDKITQRIIERSHKTRTEYLTETKKHYGQKVARENLACTNLAHAIAAEDSRTKIILKEVAKPNLAIVTAYNDMLSAHQPYYRYPENLKEYALQAGASAQVAGGVPAMCDGVTQGQVGMELSLFSRDTIAMSTAIGLSHNMFDGVLALGVCDKIVPGLLIGCLSFGHLPAVFVPAGPMESGISNKEKANTRKLFAEGKVGKEALLESEMKSYHSAGTCTFYGTANSNQMFMEIMGLHIPNAAFAPPHSNMREIMNKEAVYRLAAITALGKNFTPIAEVITEKTIVNAMIGLIATGGSTNHTIHLPAIARAAGILIDWDDFNELSQVVPLLARIYPNGSADINQFESAGGMAVIIRELLDAGLLHNDVKTIIGDGLDTYAKKVSINSDSKLEYKSIKSLDNTIISSVDNPFDKEGGIVLLSGSIGRGVSKISAIDKSNRYVRAVARVFTSQEAVIEAYKANTLNLDVIVVLKYQGPKANGMPELHGLTPALSSLQDQGFKVALVTDGRMSGASGKVPNAIHMTPEALDGGMIDKIIDGDIITLDLDNGILAIDGSDISLREAQNSNIVLPTTGFGRNLFTSFRRSVGNAESGALSLF